MGFEANHGRWKTNHTANSKEFAEQA